MNILILNWRDPRNPSSGGAEIVTLEHAKAWVHAGHSVDWFSGKFFKSKDQETIDGVEIYRKGGNFTTLLFAPFFYLKRRHKYDIVIDEIHGLPYFTPLYVRKPIIVFIHEVAGEIWDYMYPFPINKTGKFIEAFYFHLYKKVKFWTVSESTESDLIRMGIQDITVIHNGISTEKSLVTKEKSPTFIFVSRLVKMKGVEDVIEAFSYIQKKQPNAQLWIVGSGEEAYIKQLKEYVYSHQIDNNVVFFGSVDERRKFELLKRAHILLHASVKEGWGLVVVEAASQKTPAVVYNVAGLRDSVKNNITGIITSENSPQELAETSIRLLENKKKYQTLQEKAYQFACSLTWEKSTSRSLKLLDHL